MTQVIDPFPQTTHPQKEKGCVCVCVCVGGGGGGGGGSNLLQPSLQESTPKVYVFGYLLRMLW